MDECYHGYAPGKCADCHPVEYEANKMNHTTTADKGELLPCPFCGKQASAEGKIRYHDKHEAWFSDGTRVTEAFFCNCPTCGASNKGIVGHQTREKAVAAWNLRPTNAQGEQECREEFEQWLLTTVGTIPIFDRDSGRYFDSNVHQNWRSWTTAWNRRPANEGQDGLTDEDVEDWALYSSDGDVLAINTPDVLEHEYMPKHPGSAIKPHSYKATAIARHLSSKQATRPGNAPMYDPNDVAFPKGFMPVNDVQDHSERHLKMVKADAVKMPEPDGWLVNWPSDNSIKQQSYVPFKPKIGYTTAVPRYTADQLQSYATAHTAEAIRELVEGLGKAISQAEMRICTHDETHRGGAIWEICDQCGAKWADDEGGKPEFVWPKAIVELNALLAKYAPSQEVL